MLRLIGVLLLGFWITACSASEDEGSMMPDPTDPPITVTPPADPPTTPPPTEPPVTPPTDPNSAPSIETSSIKGRETVALSNRISATDADGDTITFSLIEGPDWLEISNTGHATGTPTGISVGTSDIIVEAFDGTDKSRRTITLEIAYDPIEQALRTGDFTFIENESATDTPTALLDFIDQKGGAFDADIAEIFQLAPNGTTRSDSLTNVRWDYGRHTVVLSGTFGHNAPLFISNDSGDANHVGRRDVLGLIGRTETSRYIVLGDSPIHTLYNTEAGMNDQMQNVMVNMADWLLDKSDSTTQLDIVTSQIPRSDGDDVRAWLDDTYSERVNYNDQAACDDAANFDACITSDTDLIIISHVQEDDAFSAQVTARLEQAMTDGVPVLYLHRGTGARKLGHDIFDLLNIQLLHHNFFNQVRLRGFSPVDTVHKQLAPVPSAAKFLVSGIESNSLDYDLSHCGSSWACPDHTAYNTEIASRLQTLRTSIAAYDTAIVNPFPANTNHRFAGLLLLAGDYYRDQTVYPMMKTSTPSTEIIRAMFGDFTAMVFRTHNPAPRDLGTYSREEFDDGLRTNETVNLTSQQPYRTAGVYAFPGETVTVTRNDNSDVQVRLRVHSMRDHANAPFKNHPRFNQDGYTRPVLISSRHLVIAPGETLQFTSPYGGPIHVYFNSNGQDVELDFQNTGKHPVWRGPEDSGAFLIALAADQFDWTEFVTPFFEVHTTTEKMRETIDISHFASPKATGDAIEAYFRDWPHWQAGKEGPGISDNPDLRAFATANGLTIPQATTVKHMYSDRSSCVERQSGCLGLSGNPYDTYIAFDPLSRLDLHELGHGLEGRPRHHFVDGDPVHSTTNLYAFHSQYRYYRDTGRTDYGCGYLPQDTLYGAIQDSRSRADPGQFMRDRGLGESNNQQVIFVQLLAALQNQNVLDDGWQLFPRLHLVTYRFNRSNNDEAWAENASGLGFAGMDRATAYSLSQNDWLLIALSWAAQRDLISYLDMWGYEYSAAARAHVASLGLPRLSPAYYAIGTRDHCFGLDHPELPINGTTKWPASAKSSKVASFTPDYLSFEHDDFCAIGDHSEDRMMSTPDDFR